MYTLNTITRKRIFVALSGVFAILLTACGSHSNNGYGDTDGIYTSEQRTSVAEDDYNTEEKTYYGQYFKSKEGAYSDLPEDGAIFTDIEAYKTTDTLDADGNIIIQEAEYTEGYGAWGSNSGEVTVNIYNNGYNYGYWHRPFWWYGAGWGYTNYWYGYGPYVGIGYGWGYPYYGGFCYGYPYNYGYYNGINNPYYNPYYYNGYGHSIAYNRGRRNVGYSPGRTALRTGRSTLDSRRSSYSRSETARRANNTNARRSNTVYRNNTNTVRRNTQTTRPSNNSSRTIRNSNSSRSRNNSVRNNTSRSTRTISRPSSSSRSSGSVRSSSGGSRSSGSSRSGGGRRGGGR